MRKALILSLLAVLAGGIPAFAAPIVINEFNAVGDGKTASGGDTFFGPNYPGNTGNGGNWIELVVVQDHVDIRGFTIAWENSDPDSGSIEFTNNALWSNLRQGTIITIREDDDGDSGTPVGIRPTDVSFDPVGGDWWLEINVADATYITESGFKVDNDDWQATIISDIPSIVQGPVGESAGAPWSGGGLSSTEIGSLSITPTSAPIVAGYIDANYSSYGAANVGQDLSGLRAWVPEPSSYVLAMFAACGGATMVWRRRRR